MNEWLYAASANLAADLVAATATGVVVTSLLPWIREHRWPDRPSVDLVQVLLEVGYDDEGVSEPRRGQARVRITNRESEPITSLMAVVAVENEERGSLQKPANVIFDFVDAKGAPIGELLPPGESAWSAWIRLTDPECVIWVEVQYETFDGRRGRKRYETETAVADITRTRRW